MSKHTPGPWKVINGFDDKGNGRWFPSVVLGGAPRGLRNGEITVNASHDQETESIMANARLIAAAPDLLEACKVMLDFMNIHHTGTKMRDVLRAAIAKAE